MVTANLLRFNDLRNFLRNKRYSAFAQYNYLLLSYTKFK